MTVAIMISVAIGIAAGTLWIPHTITPHMGPIITAGLCLLLFLVGISAGGQEGLMLKLKRMGFRILLVPLMVGLGSIFGAAAGGLMLNIPLRQASAVGAGFGWYTFVGVELTKHSAQLGALAFMTNFSRELIALLIIPFVAKHVGFLESIGPAGATGSTVTLPIISQATDPGIAMVAFLTGMILSSLVPFLVPFIMALG